MLRLSRLLPALLVLLSGAPATAADDGPWTGTWVTDEGAMTLSQSGDDVSGNYGRGGEVKGTASGKKFECTYRIANASGQAQFEIQEDGHFTGKWMIGGDSGTWRGWKRDPKAEERSAAAFRSASPPASMASGRGLRPKSSGRTSYSRNPPARHSATRVGPARETSSSPSRP